MSDLAPYIGTVITVVIAVVSVYVGISSRLAKLETLVSELSKDVEKHNNLVERTYKLETDVSNLYHRYSEIRTDVNHLKIGGQTQ
jgi:hypothetical protein